MVGVIARFPAQGMARAYAAPGAIFPVELGGDAVDLLQHRQRQAAYLYSALHGAVGTVDGGLRRGLRRAVTYSGLQGECSTEWPVWSDWHYRVVADRLRCVA
ncbi:hypothetical protein D3C77_723270 [compost metagenome]